MTDYCLALWATNLGFSPAHPQAFADHVEARLLEAKAAGAKLLVLPEYAIEACLAFKPARLKPTEEMAFLAEVGAQVVELLRPLPQAHGISLLAGSMPVPAEGGLTNTAILLTPDGREIRQDKLSLTPGEMDPETWQLQGGRELLTFELDGLKMAILICLDVEMPALSCLLAKENLDLLLVPSMTEMLSGYHRVFDCAKARAVELMTSVAVCGTVGRTPGTTQMETNVSGASLFVPCEEELGFTGVAGAISATDGMAAEEPFLIAKVPVGTVRALRAGGGEVWPGGWSADHIVVTRTS
ncbi:nitrilase-related carbon-nitrogen hydrolase [Roseibium polysiphoniae]|uniref:Nitrilase n=1 Tax=Roseibium polysiphoniae TaxID=2571221 RepID=A0ABR9C7Q0_9HYPH|nr:nitrilase-related carbon-nitrogen hydrolase [Roseibium polysiphoniae]MBD8875633.1 nitrilase [Roseibium polysiphoniae]